MSSSRVFQLLVLFVAHILMVFLLLALPAPSTEAAAHAAGVRYALPVASGAYDIGTCVSPPSGLVSWWPGDDSAVDIVGSNNGAIVNGVTYVPGMVGQAFNFSGSGDYVQVLSPAGLPLGNSPRTMMFWFKTPSSWGDTNQVVIQYGGNSTGSKFGIYIPDYWSRTMSFWGEGSDFAGSTSLQLGTWYHGAVIYDGSTISLYLNGQIETSASRSWNTQINSGGFTIGRTSSYDNITSEWNGFVDEAAIFNRALTAGEIAAIYAAGSAGMCGPDTTPPTVVSVLRADANPTIRAGVDFIVTFSESVTGVDGGDFSLTTTGITGATVSGVVASGSVYSVTVSTGNGRGTIRLDVMDDDSIVDSASNPLGGAGPGNGNYTSGEVYYVRWYGLYLPLVLK